MSQVIFVLLMLGGFMIPAALFGMWWIFWVFMLFGICFGAMEGIAVWKTKKTVSQHFWEFAQKHPIKAKIILGGMLISWFALLAHLGFH